MTGLNSTLDLCQYNVAWLTETEVEAIEEYHRAVPHCLVHTPLDDLLSEPGDVAAALRKHADLIGTWHAALVALLADPRLAHTPDPATVLPVGSKVGTGPYSPAAGRFVQMAADQYHRERGHFEYTVTRWALRLTTYPEETRALDATHRALTILD